MAPRTQQARKNKQRNNVFPASDYESDFQHHQPQHQHQHQPQYAAQAGPSTAQYSPSISRISDSIPERNFKVISRYLPSLVAVLDRVAQATVYLWNDETWERADTDGPMFLVELGPGSNGGGGRTRCLVLLPKKRLGVLILDLARINAMEYEREFLMCQPESVEALMGSISVTSTGELPACIALFITPTGTDPSEPHVQIIRDAWEEAQAERDEMEGQEPQGEHALVADGPAMLALGRKPSLRELFGTGGGGGAIDADGLGNQAGY